MRNTTGTGHWPPRLPVTDGTTGTHGNAAHAHRRSFARTTILAICGLVLLLAAVATFLALFPWSTADDHVPAWVIGLAIAAVTIVLIVLVAYACLIVIGGVVVLHRDSCEERGLPYLPTRPRERIISPMRAAIRRSIRPGARFLPGELAEVRTLPEILATLDDRGCLDGMPFMPEMATYCGHRFPVHRRVDKVWEYAHDTGLRRVHDAVLLKTLRCDGQSHGGCQAACELIWKEAWLRAAGSAGVRPPGIRSTWRHARRSSVDGERRYVCQMTEIIRASTQLSQRDPRHYWRDLVGGNVRLAPLLVVLSIRAFNGMNWRLRGVPWPVLKPPGERFLTAPGGRVAARSMGPGEVEARHRIDPESQAPQPWHGIRQGHAVLLWRQLSSGGPRRPHRGRAHR